MHGLPETQPKAKAALSVVAKIRFPYDWLFLSIPLILTLLLYGQTLTFPVDGESAGLIQLSPERADLRAVHTIRDLAAKWVIFGYVRPIWNLSFLVDRLVWNENSGFGFHATNLILHCCNVILLYWLLYAIFDDRLLAAGAGVIWSVFPWTAYVVGWVAQRNDSLAAMFMLLSIIVFYRAYAGNHRVGWGILSALFYGLALMSKETSLLFPVGLVAIIAITGLFRDKTNLAFVGVIPHLALLGFYLWLRVLLIGGLRDPAAVAIQMSYFAREYGEGTAIALARLAINMPLLIMQTFVPFDLFLRPRAFLSTLFGFLILLVMLVIAVKKRIYKQGELGHCTWHLFRWPVAGMSWFVILASPLVVQPTSRLLYISSLGPAVIITSSVLFLWRQGGSSYLWRSVLIVAVSLIILGYVSTTIATIHQFSPDCYIYMGADPQSIPDPSCCVECGFQETVKEVRRHLHVVFRQLVSPLR